MQQPPNGYPHPHGYPPPPQGYYQPPQWGPPAPPPPPPQNGWEGSKTLTSLLVGCLALVLIVVVGPWVGCAACACAGGVIQGVQGEAPPRRHR